MKDKFFGYIPYSEDTYKNLWDKATFIFDTNILLNLYRYSKDTQQRILSILKKISDRVWIPYNTAQEFFNNRINVIIEQEKIHEQIQKQINLSNVKSYISNLRHITLGLKKQQMLEIIQKYESELNKIIDDDKDEEKSLIYDDNILKEIIELFNNRVGEKIDDEKIKSMILEIDRRYQLNIPPGYEDAKKNKEGRKYGDCINWLSIIEYAQKNNTDVIYITDENKMDWIETIGSKKIGPRKELLDEFYKKTNGKIIYIYNTQNFIEYFSKYLDVKKVINYKIIEEIKNVYERRNEHLEFNLSYEPNIESKYNDIGITFNDIKQKQNELRRGLFGIKEEVNNLNELYNNLSINGNRNEEKIKFIESVCGVLEEEISRYLEISKPFDKNIYNEFMKYYDDLFKIIWRVSERKKIMRI